MVSEGSSVNRGAVARAQPGGAGSGRVINRAGHEENIAGVRKIQRTKHLGWYREMEERRKRVGKKKKCEAELLQGDTFRCSEEVTDIKERESVRKKRKERKAGV